MPEQQAACTRRTPTLFQVSVITVTHAQCLCLQKAWSTKPGVLFHVFRTGAELRCSKMTSRLVKVKQSPTGTWPRLHLVEPSFDPCWTTDLQTRRVRKRAATQCLGMMPSHMFIMTSGKLDTLMYTVIINMKMCPENWEAVGELWKFNWFFIVSGKQLPDRKIKYSVYKHKLQIWYWN